MQAEFLLGNELIALGAKDAGANCAYAYPGTPSSEILSAFKEFSPERYSQWAVNEKVALELAAAEAVSGRRVLCSMKQVGLNVAADPLFSVAYTGVAGALVIVSADDPGPYSSQTEQDSRAFAQCAKVPVFDPENPRDAYRLTLKAFEISEKYQVPVIIRPVMRVCHSRQSFSDREDTKEPQNTEFEKDTSRWAATPKFRNILHNKLNRNLEKIAEENAPEIPALNSTAILTSGYCAAVVADTVQRLSAGADVIKVDMPYPLSADFLRKLEEAYGKIIVIEETSPVMEREFFDKSKIYGRVSGHIPSEGEVTADVVQAVLTELEVVKAQDIEACDAGANPPAKPRLCAGCGHRPAFYSIKKGAPKGIYPGDIGCYTLGINMNAVDTCICMGASITFAEGLKRANPDKPVVCTIGDSTFFHTGIAGLLNAKVQKSPIVVCILDNSTTAMTGFQPVAHEISDVSIEDVCRGLGIKNIETLNAYNIKKGTQAVKDAAAKAEEDGEPSVIIFRKACVTHTKERAKVYAEVQDNCMNCTICYEVFECPAISFNLRSVGAYIDADACTGCMVCAQVCPAGAIKAVKRGEK